MLSLKNVNKYYKTSSNNFHALKDINLFVEEGEFVAILGESGSGKSTLLNVISGLDTYESGDITINGISTKDFSKKEWAIYRNNYVGFVFQEYNLVEHLTIAENVELPLLLQGVKPKEARRRALEKCALLGLKKHTHKKPKKVSGGQQQRAAIARALVTEPKVILADEPTGALDSENAKIILDILKALSKDHVVILVTHDEENAHNYANRIVTLEDGNIISDSNENLNHFVHSSDLDLKRPSMNLKVLWKFAKNNVSKRFIRTMFTACTMAIGLISIFLITFLINGIKTEVTDLISSIIPEDQYFITSEVRDAIISDEKYEQVKNMEEISEAFFQYNIRPLVNKPTDEDDNVIKYYQPENYDLIGIPKSEKNFFYNSKLTGQYPKTENEIIITSSLAEKIIGIANIKKDNLDDAFNLVKDKTFTVERVSISKELNEEFKIVGIIHSTYQQVFSFNSKLEKIAQDITEEDMQMYGRQAVDKSSIIVYLNINRQKDIDNFKDTLADDGLVLKNPVKIVYGTIDSFFDTVLYILVGTASVSLVVAGILVGLMIYISVIERIKEIGILTSLGAKGSNIISLFLFESGFIGFLSSFIALVFSVLISLLINNIFNSTIGELLRTLKISQLDTFKLLHIDYITILIVFGISILFAMLSGLIPAILASRLKAVEALRKE